MELELENRALKASLRSYKARARTFRRGAAAGPGESPLCNAPRQLEVASRSGTSSRCQTPSQLLCHCDTFLVVVGWWVVVVVGFCC